MPQIHTTNPTTGQKICSYDYDNSASIEAKIAASSQAYPNWRHAGFTARANCLQNLADELIEQQQRCAEQITKEMGMPITAALAEINKCAKTCNYFAQHASSLLSPKTVATQHQKSTVYYEALGPIFSILPWNFPFWQCFRQIASSLMAGNSSIFKTASCTTGCGQLIIELCEQAGFPPGVVQACIIEQSSTEQIISDRRIKGVSFTGSSAAGSNIAALAGKYLKPQVLELGGSDPYLLLEDADITLAAAVCAAARLINCGQCCISAKRIIVPAAILDDFIDELKKQLINYPQGDPMLAETRLGPMAQEQQRQSLHQQVTESIQQGAKLICGGEINKEPGFYYPATILNNVSSSMPVFAEETFGPVFAISSYKTQKEGIALANQSPYGLGGCVFSENIELAEKIARNDIDSGSCFVNSQVSTQAELPAGGINDSGFGRELGEAGIKAFVNVKTVCVDGISI